MGEDDFQPLDNADDGQLDVAGAEKGIGNIKINQADLPAYKRKLKEAIRNQARAIVKKEENADTEGQTEAPTLIQAAPSLISLEKMQRKIDIDTLVPEW